MIKKRYGSPQLTESGRAECPREAPAGMLNHAKNVPLQRAPRVPPNLEKLFLTSRVPPMCPPVSPQSLEKLFLTSRVPPKSGKYLFFTVPRDGLVR